MMLSPASVQQEYETMSYQQLLEEKENLMNCISRFEAGEFAEQSHFCPSAAVQYQMNLEYLGVLAPVIAEKFRMLREQE